MERLLEQHYQVKNHELYVSGTGVQELVQQYGSPLFVYDANVIKKTIQSVQGILPSRFKLYYSIKANPNVSVLKLMLDQGLGLEVASGGELFQALEAGCPAQRIIYAGPGKTRQELSDAVDAGIGELHIESVEEARQVDEICQKSAKQIDVCLRINPTDAAGGAMRMGGKPSPFGIDEETLDETLSEIKTLRHLNIVGIHLFMGTQILDASVLFAQYQRALSLARQVASKLPSPLRSIDFGGGWGTPYFPHEKCLKLLDVKNILHRINEELEADALLSQVQAIIEPGRYLVNEAGIYLSKVTRTKNSRGKTFVVIDGGMHHHLAASGNLGQTIKRNFPVAIANKLKTDVSCQTEVVGPLCTPLDTLARNATLPPASQGDIFCVFQSGAYARTSSPHDFLSHAPPAEVMITGETCQLVRRRGTPADLLRDQKPYD